MEMTNNRPLKIPIFFKSEKDTENESLKELGIDIEEESIRNNPIKECLFYSIGAVTPYEEDDIVYSKVFAQGDCFISSVLFADFEEFISKQLTN